MSPWVFGRDSCRAMVLHSFQDVDPDSVELTADQAAKYFCSGYTYVKLEIGRVWHTARRCQACRSHHITLAYAAPMSDDQRAALQTNIESALAMWFNTKPLARPSRLKVRRCRVRGPGDAWFTVAVHQLSDEVIKAMDDCDDDSGVHSAMLRAWLDRVALEEAAAN